MTPKPKQKSFPENSRRKRKWIEAQLKEMVKAIISWRDGQMCVEADVDGSRCGNGLMWGHFITQHASPWLRYNLSNVFWQCGNHNLIHDKHDLTYRIWYAAKFGDFSRNMIEREAAEHIGKKQKMYELEEMLERYIAMYETRYGSYEIEEMVRLGYYGEIIKAAWEKEGRI